MIIKEIAFLISYVIVNLTRSDKKNRKEWQQILNGL